MHLEPAAWRGHYDLGLFYQRHGERQQALEALERAARTNPGSIVALNTLAVETLNKGDLTAAGGLLDLILTLDPKNAIGHANLGALYARLGQPEQALAAFQAAAASDPTLATAHYNLGVLYRRLGQPDQALAAFHEAERLDPGLSQAKKGRTSHRPERRARDGREAAPALSD